MLLDSGASRLSFDDGPAWVTPRRWGAASESGLLTDVLLSRPTYLEIVPSNTVSRESLALGLCSSPAAAARQHGALSAALERAGVRCHFARPSPRLADLCFTRDAILISPWGLIELRPAAHHRRAEPAHVATEVSALGVPCLGRVGEGHVEGGDVCMLRDGLLLIGHSGERTDEAGARALGALFESRGWEVIHTRFDPRYLHFDTLFTMVSDDCAVACIEALEPGFVERSARLGIEIIPARLEEIDCLGVNLLSLGHGRVVAPAGNERLNGILMRRGFEVIAVEMDQFTRCGGGAHCLAMPLSRQ